MSNIAFKCDCGWMAVEDPHDMWDDVAQLIDDHVDYCPKNENDPVIRQDTGAVRADPNPHEEEQMTTTNPTAHLSASELNQMIHHPIWCSRPCCVESEGMGDVWHESRVQTKTFDTDPVRRNQPFTASSKLARYSVAGKEDSPAGVEITLDHGELLEEISLFMDPNTLRDLARWLNDRADEVDIACGKDGLA